MNDTHSNNYKGPKALERHEQHPFRPSSSFLSARRSHLHNGHGLSYRSNGVGVNLLDVGVEAGGITDLKTMTNKTATMTTARPRVLDLSRRLRRMKRRLLLEAASNPNFSVRGSSQSSSSSSLASLSLSSSSFGSVDYGSTRRLRMESNDSLPSLDEEQEERDDQGDDDNDDEHMGL